MLELHQVCKTFNPGTVNEKAALNHLSLTLEEGDFVTVIGGNGAGKSTMLNAISGVWPVDAGTVRIDGVDVTELSEHQRAVYLGRVFQDPMVGTAGNMTIEENLALAARRGEKRTLRWGIKKSEREQFKELLRPLGLGLEDRLTAKVGLLSGGQRQALTLLMASLKKPKVLLLDEHTAALDPKTAAKVLELFKRLLFHVEHEVVSNADLVPDWDDVTSYPLFPEFRKKFLMAEWWETYEIPPEKRQKYVRRLNATIEVEPRFYMRRYVTSVRVARGSMVSRMDLVHDAKALDRMQGDLIEANNEIFRLRQSLNIRMADTVAEFLADVYSKAPGASLSVAARRWAQKQKEKEKEREKDARKEGRQQQQ